MIDGLTDTITAEKLAAEPEFVALCAVWQKEKHCPLVMPDYLRELGCERAAMVAVWAVNHVTIYGRRLQPCQRETKLIEFYFVSHDKDRYGPFKHPWWVPKHYRKKDGMDYYLSYHTFIECVSHFLLNADPKALFRLAPPKPEFCVIEL